MQHTVPWTAKIRISDGAGTFGTSWAVLAGLPINRGDFA